MSLESRLHRLVTELNDYIAKLDHVSNSFEIFENSDEITLIIPTKYRGKNIFILYQDDPTSNIPGRKIDYIP